jgi:hypothetical protein
MSEEYNTQGDMETSIEGNQVENLSHPELESVPENKGVGEGLGEDEVSELMVPSAISDNVDSLFPLFTEDLLLPFWS